MTIKLTNESNEIQYPVWNYDSFQRFCKEKAPTLAKEVFLKKIQEDLPMYKIECLGVHSPLAPEPEFALKHPEFTEDDEPADDFRQYGCTLWLTLRVNGGEPFTMHIAKYPWIDQRGYGIHHYQESGNTQKAHFRRRAFIYKPALSMAPSISMEKDKTIVVSCKGNTRLVISSRKKEPYVRFSANGQSYPLLSLVSSLAVAQHADDSELEAYMSNISFYIATQYDRKELYMNNGLLSPVKGSEDFCKRFGLSDGQISLSKLKDELCDTLSLYRAVGHRLSRTLVGKNKTYPRLSYVTRDMVDDAYLAGCSCIHVLQEPFTMYPTMTRIIPTLPRGAKVYDWMDLGIDDYYAPMDMPLNYAVTYNREVSPSVFETLAESHAEPMDVKLTPSSQVVYRCTFEREILSNDCYPGKLFGSDVKWLRRDGVNLVEISDEWHWKDLVALYSFAAQAFDNYEDVVLRDPDASCCKIVNPVEYAWTEAMLSMWNGIFKSAAYRKFIKDAANDPEVLSTFHMANRFQWTFIKGMFDYLTKTSKCLVPLTKSMKINPLAVRSAMLETNVFHKDKHSIKESVRKAAIGSTGRLDLFEVPQSASIGVTNHLADGCRVSLDGELLVRYREFTDGKLGNEVWLSRAQEEEVVIADKERLHFDGDICTDNMDTMVLCRVPSGIASRSRFAIRPISEVQYVFANEALTLSTVTRTIPFLGMDNATRVTFAAAQAKEAKSLLCSEEPYVQTPVYKTLYQVSDQFVSTSQLAGTYVGQFIDPNYKNKMNMTVIAPLTEGERAEANTKIADERYTTDSCVTTRLLKRPLDQVRVGDILGATEYFSDRGVYSPGLNAFVAYIMNGAVYEDGVWISPNFSERGISSTRFEQEFSSKKQPLEVMPRNTYLLKGDHIKIRTAKNEIIRMRQPLAYSGRIVDFETEKIGDHWKLKVYLVTVNQIHQGDKLADRDGNKGVVSKVDEDVFYTLKNGRPIEVIRNPLGVETRMNLTQLREAKAGLCGHILGTDIEVGTFSTELDKLDELCQFVYDLCNMAKQPFISKYASADPTWLELADKRYDYAQEWKGTFNSNFEAPIYVNGMKTSGRASIGFVYICKMKQEGAHKMAMRAGITEGMRYATESDAPVRGIIEHGGQKLGNMEVAALAAYGANAFLHELINYRADNAAGRIELFRKFYDVTDGWPRENESGRRRAVTGVLAVLYCLGVKLNFSDKKVLPIEKCTYSYKPEAILDELHHAAKEKKQELYIARKEAKQQSAEERPALVPAPKVDPIRIMYSEFEWPDWATYFSLYLENENDFRELSMLNGDKPNWSREKYHEICEAAKKYYNEHDLVDAFKDTGAYDKYGQYVGYEQGPNGQGIEDA